MLISVHFYKPFRAVIIPGDPANIPRGIFFPLIWSRELAAKAYHKLTLNYLFPHGVNCNLSPSKPSKNSIFKEVFDNRN
jgi:hypothetical protein